MARVRCFGGGYAQMFNSVSFVWISRREVVRLKKLILAWRFHSRGVDRNEKMVDWWPSLFALLVCFQEGYGSLVRISCCLVR